MYLFIVFEPVLNAVAEAAESVIKVLTEWVLTKPVIGNLSN